MNEHMVRDFAVLLSQLSGGELRDEVNEKVLSTMATLFEHAKLTNRKAKGSVSLKVEFEVEPNGLATILGDVDTKVPKPLRSTDHFYTDEGGGFCRNNPRQMNLPIRDVAQSDKPVREVEYDPETGDVKETIHG